MSFYNALRGLSMSGGLVLVGVGAFLNVSKAAEVEGSLTSPICIAIIALAFGSALAVSVMLASWQSGRKGLAAFAFLGLICSESYMLQLSAERLLASREQRTLQVQQSGNPYLLAKAALDGTVKEREKECVSGFGKNCSKLRVLEDEQRAKLGSLTPPGKVALLANATGLPDWLVEIVPALLFSVGLQVLGFVLVGFADCGPSGRAAKDADAPVVELSDTERVVSWVREYRRRYGKSPSIPMVQQEFGLPKTTAWRRINSA